MWRRDPLPAKQDGARSTMILCPARKLARTKDLRAVAPADHEPLGINQAPNNALEPMRMSASIIREELMEILNTVLRMAQLER